jgi:hypothetical protein
MWMVLLFFYNAGWISRLVVLFVAINLGALAKKHHEWYLQKFGRSYPPHRARFIPGVW